MKRLAARLLAAVMALTLIAGLFTGCASGKWKGEWNRTGDATYSRAEMRIYDVDRKGFTFDLLLYNGNVVGRLEALQAFFVDRSCTEAVYEVPNSHASITFSLNEKNEVDVLYMGGTSAGNYIIEQQMFGFEAEAYITGNFVRGETSYLNSSFVDIGMLTEDEDALVRKIMPEDMYERCRDCFQYWEKWEETKKNSKTGLIEKTGKTHDDDIGGFIYYGKNRMQEKAGIIIIFDDGTVAIVVSRDDGSLVYYCDNHIYGSGEVYPLPITIWMEEYYGE